MHFTRWVRRHERTVMVVLAVTLAVSFGAGSGLPRMIRSALGGFLGRGEGAGTVVAYMFDEPVTEDDFGWFSVRWGRFPFAVENIDEAWTAFAAVRLAQRLGIRVSDDELKKQVWSLPVFFDDPQDPQGRFSRERYEALLSSRKMSKPDFEETMREFLAVLKLRSLLFDTALVTSAEVWPQYRDRNLSYRTAAVRYPVEDYLADVPEPSEEELAAFFEQQKEGRYRQPERIQVEVLAAPYDAFAGELEVTEEEARAYYEAHPDLFPAPADPQEAGEKPLAAVRPFDEAREEVLEKLRLDRARERAEAALDDVRKQLLAEPETTLASLAEASDGKLQSATTEFFASDELADVPLLGESFSPDSPLLASLFRLDESKREVSSVIAGEDASVLCRLLARERARVPTLEEVKEEVASDLQRDRAAELARQTAASLSDELTEKGLSLTSEEVKGRGLEVTVSSWYKAYDSDAPDFAKGVPGHKAGDMAALKTADAAYLIEVLETRPPTEAEFQADVEQEKRFTEMISRRWVLPSRWDAIVRRETGLEVLKPPEEEQEEPGDLEPEEQPAEEAGPEPEGQSATFPGASAAGQPAESPSAGGSVPESQ